MSCHTSNICNIQNCIDNCICSAKLINPKPVIVSIDGNIGSGKSTKVFHLKNYFTQQQNNTSKRIYFLQEPVDDWHSIVDKDGTPILTNFYKDTKKFAFRFQMMAYISRLTLLRKAVKSGQYDIIISERCVATDRNVFAKMLYDAGDIEEDEYNIYNKWYHEFLDDVPITGLIYIKASPEICMERIKKRAREGENIPYDYIASCNQYHDNWIENETCKKLIIDGNQDSEINPTILIEHVKKIEEFIYSL